MPSLKKGVHGVFIHTRDLKRSAEWYSWLLDVPFEAEEVHSPVYNIPVSEGVHLTIDDHSFDPTHVFEPVHTPVFNFFSDDVRKSCEELEHSGVSIKRDVEQHGDFGWFTIEDPDGNAVMICGTVK
ncbi:VOC family protein [Halobacillus litoralis]|uniref:VOC family protein n=1 Tax=Halobacillus litoralis TaxID=45668 RepID=UPI001CD71C96|nr:VOC family protein [Halobacillus litoralis]MCA0972810.1 VOC family protein [Halobacillus litoralis]